MAFQKVAKKTHGERERERKEELYRNRRTKLKRQIAKSENNKILRSG